jgi:hypothetical protein
MQVQAIVDHHHPHDGVRTTISKVRFVDPAKSDDEEKGHDESNEVNSITFLCKHKLMSFQIGFSLAFCLPRSG